MNEHDVAERIRNLLETASDVAEDDEFGFGPECRVATFEEAGVLTMNGGVVLTLGDGSEFQITIVRSA